MSKNVLLSARTVVFGAAFALVFVLQGGGSSKQIHEYFADIYAFLFEQLK